MLRINCTYISYSGELAVTVFKKAPPKANIFRSVCFLSGLMERLANSLTISGLFFRVCSHQVPKINLLCKVEAHSNAWAIVRGRGFFSLSGKGRRGLLNWQGELETNFGTLLQVL